MPTHHGDVSKVQHQYYSPDALRDIPGYVKFLQDAVASKLMLGKFETVNLTEECSAIIQRKLSTKQKDPGRFTLSFKIGEHVLM